MTTQQTDVEKQVTHLIIPFAYRTPYRDAAAAVDPERFEVKDVSADRLFDYAEHLVSSDETRQEAIGRRWGMRQRARKGFGLPNNHNAALVCRAKEQEWPFYFLGAELYLFETQVGFLVFSIDFTGWLGMEDRIEALYHLKKIAQFGHAITVEVKMSKDVTETRSLNLSGLALEMLKDFEPETFFEGKRDKPTEAIVYTCVLLDAEGGAIEEHVDAYLFHLRRSFKASYKPSDEERDVRGNPDLLRLFDNSRWGVSLEGIANLVTKTADPVTDRFFAGPYFHHIEHTYAYLYILALHQKYALLHFTNQASRLSHRLTAEDGDVREQNRLLNRMRRQIVDFLLRSSYKNVSRSTHHTALYEWIRDRLRIEGLFGELHESMNALASLTEMAERKIEQEEDSRKQEAEERFNKKITVIGAVFLPISVVTSVFGMSVTWVDAVADVWWVFPLASMLLYAATYAAFKYRLNRD